MNRIFESWLEGQLADWNKLAPETDLVKVTAVGPESPSRKFIAEYSCKGLVRLPNGEIAETDHFVFGIHFREDHQRRIEPLQLVTLLSPPQVWHPNILPGPGICCPGHLNPGVGLNDILFQIYSIVTYQNFNLGDCLNFEARDWARENRDRFPIDSRPLKRRQFQFTVTEVTE